MAVAPELVELLRCPCPKHAEVEYKDRRNLILLSVQSLGSTWDVVGSRGREAWSVGRARSAPAATAASTRASSQS